MDDTCEHRYFVDAKFVKCPKCAEAAKQKLTLAAIERVAFERGYVSAEQNIIAMLERKRGTVSSIGTLDALLERIEKHDHRPPNRIIAAYASRVAAYERLRTIAGEIREHEYRLRCEGSLRTNLAAGTFAELTVAIWSLDALDAKQKGDQRNEPT